MPLTPCPAAGWVCTSPCCIPLSAPSCTLLAGQITDLDIDSTASREPTTETLAREQAHLGVAHNHVSHINVGRQAEHWGRPPGLDRHTDNAVLSLHLQAQGVSLTTGAGLKLPFLKGHCVVGLGVTLRDLQAVLLYFGRWAGRGLSVLSCSNKQQCSHHDLITVVSQGLRLEGHHHLSVHARRNHARLPRAEEGWGGHHEEACCRWQDPAAEAWQAGLRCCSRTVPETELKHAAVWAGLCSPPFAAQHTLKCDESSCWCTLVPHQAA